MKRTSLLLAAVGGAAVLAVTGTALGVSAAERAPAPAPVAETTDPAPVDPSATTSTPGTPSATTSTPGTPSATTSTPGTPSATTSTPGTPSATTSTPGTPASTGSTAPATDDPVSQQRAGEIALAKAGGGQITEIEREQEEGRPVWSVEIINGDTEHEVEVDRESGAIVKSEQEKADHDDRSGRDDDDDDSDDGDDD
ncbi:PepSY domain-containing protein [Micromonospora sp. NBC_00421]|uniref:PepSY domain-containing protein n=1 Tax=Micromonospora sp. NBC_00421 TaxID=2975976 RepID=UPI002E23B0E6